MNTPDRKQIIQENEFLFPYHYIPTWDGRRFSQIRMLRWGYIYLSYLNFVIDKAFEIGFDSLLDIGCGDGRFLSEIQARTPEKRLTGIDPSAMAIDLARTLNPAIRWVCGSIDSPDMPDSEFDMATAIEVLEHLPDDVVREFVSAVGRRLRKGGHWIISVPSRNVPVPEKHYRHYSPRELIGLLEPVFTISGIWCLNRKTSIRLRVIEKMLANRFFVLNDPYLLKTIYLYYNRHFLVTDPDRCRRIVLVCRKRD